MEDVVVLRILDRGVVIIIDVNHDRLASLECDTDRISSFVQMYHALYRW